MELLFGVAGPSHAVPVVCERLTAESSRSNPGLALKIVNDDELAVGYALRRFASWTSPDDLSFHLDGELRSIDGTDAPGPDAADALFRRLAEAYRRDPVRFWERIDGSYCLIVRDGRVVSVGVDVVGARSLYWWTRGGVLAFHSHLQDLAPAYGDDLTEDDGALAQFLAAGVYPPARTAYREVHHLGAGEVLQFADGVARVREHLSMVYRAARPHRSRRVLVDELVDLVGAAVRNAARSLEAPVFPLSGGLDSRYLVAEFIECFGPVPTITWGADPARRDSDAVIARRVAKSLAVENTWFEKPQLPTPETFSRAIYLSSGEADCAIHFPDDHELHARLARARFRSIVRGDESFGNGPTLFIRHSAIAANGIARLKHGHGYETLIESGRLRRMADEQSRDLDEWLACLRSPTATGARDEVRYASLVRRVLAPYNRVKHTDLEVVAPFMARPILEWLRQVPDSERFDKALLKAAFARKFPLLAAMPYAARSNTPDWEARWRLDRKLPRFYLDWCGAPGWLDQIGSRSSVVEALEREVKATSSSSRAASPSRTIGARAWLKRTVPGRIARELTLDMRNEPPTYLRLARLAVLHGLLGDIERRNAAPIVLPTLAGPEGAFRR